MARKILLADDSVTAQNMGRKILTDAGYEVITVNNGSAALKKIAETKPDLIVLDVYMPGYSGLEVCQRIKENRETSRIPILLTVGKLEPFKPEEARRARADAFVVKPFEASELLSALTKLEDKIVPGAEPYKQGRFAKAIASVEREAEPGQLAEEDEGWKARLRIPTGPPKETEPPVDYAATQGKGFRDFIEPPARRGSPKPTPPAVPATSERPVAAALPQDITPEEIAAITAAAAQLKGRAPAEPIAVAGPEPEREPVATDAGPTTAIAEEMAPVTFASAPETDASSADERELVVTPEPDFVEAVQEPPDAQIHAAVSAPTEEISVVTETATSAEQIPSAAEVAPSTVESAPPAEFPAPPSLAEPVPVAVRPADEPLPPQTPTNESPAEVVASAEVEPVAEPANTAIAQDLAAQTAPAPVIAISEAAPVADVTPAADDEVMAALHALIPVDASASEGMATQAAGHIEMAASVGQISGEAPIAYAATGSSRWIAEEVTLSSEEASLLLDREMDLVATAAQAPSESISAPDGVAHEFANLVATPPDNLAHEIPEVHAVATAAGAEFPAPWPIGQPAPAEIVETHISNAAETMAEPALPQASEVASNLDTEPGGGIDDMAANWKNIRDSIAASAAKPAPAKEEFAEAAAAGAEAASAEVRSSDSIRPEAAATKMAATDPTAIANIVESVLAELRPRIVEEIARKLSDPKK